MLSIFKSHIGVALLAIVGFAAGCQTTKDTSGIETGEIIYLEKQSTKDEKTGEIVTTLIRKLEIAERSVADKGAESLLTAQKVASPGGVFSSFEIGPEDKIAITIYNQEGTNGSDIWIYSQGRSRLTKTTHFNFWPNFSKDGKYIYFASSRGKSAYGPYDQNSYIWRMPANGGGGITRIGTPVFECINPIESPNSELLLYSSKEYYGNSPFVWYSTNTGNLPTQLTQGTDAEWVNDGKIIFSQRDENTGLSTIWTTNLDGTELTQIISDPEMDCISPSVSPDSQLVAYVKQKPDQPTTRDIFIYNNSTGLSQQITTNTSRDDMPKWASDGSSLYFRSTRGVAWNIWRIPASRL